MAAAQWFTLVRFRGDPSHLTGVAQTRDAAEALALLQQWQERFPDHSTVVFDPQNRPIELAVLQTLASATSPRTEARES